MFHRLLCDGFDLLCLKMNRHHHINRDDDVHSFPQNYLRALLLFVTAKGVLLKCEVIVNHKRYVGIK